MKIINLLFLCFLFWACEERKDAFNSLSEDERNNLRQVNAKKCLKETERDLNDFKKDSLEWAKDLDRGDQWKHERKLDNEILRRLTVTVWNRKTDATYLMISHQSGSSVTKYQFLKISDVTNAEMMSHFRDLYCSDKMNNDFDVSFSRNRGSYKSWKTGVHQDGKRKTKTTTAFNWKARSLAFFASFDENSTHVIYKEDDRDAVEKTETTKGTFEAHPDGDFDFPSNSYTFYQGISGATEFCVVKSTTDSTGKTSYPLPYELNCSPAAGEFNPAVELAI